MAFQLRHTCPEEGENSYYVLGHTRNTGILSRICVGLEMDKVVIRQLFEWSNLSELTGGNIYSPFLQFSVW